MFLSFMYLEVCSLYSVVCLFLPDIERVILINVDSSVSCFSTAVGYPSSRIPCNFIYPLAHGEAFPRCALSILVHLSLVGMGDFLQGKHAGVE